MVNVLIIIILSLKIYYRKREKKRRKRVAKRWLTARQQYSNLCKIEKESTRKMFKDIKVMHPVSK